MNFLIYGVNNPVIVSAIYCVAFTRISETFPSSSRQYNMFKVGYSLYKFLFIWLFSVNYLKYGIWKHLITDLVWFIVTWKRFVTEDFDDIP